MQTRIKNLVVAALFILSSVLLPVGMTQNAYAATLTWTGDGDGTSFSDGNNWSTDSAPVDGDVLNFDYTGLGANTELDNDIVDLSVAGITASGTPSTYAGYTVVGNDLTLTGDVSNTASYNDSGRSFNLNVNVILADDVTVTGSVSFFGETNKINVQANTLTITSLAGDFTCKAINGLIGTGSVSIGGASDKAFALGSANAGFSGNVSISSGQIILSNVAALGSGSLTASGAGSVSLYATSNSTWTNDFTLGGSGAISAQHSSTNGCSGSITEDTYTATLTGDVTLTSDFEYNGGDNMIVDGTYDDNGFDFTVRAGATGTLTTPDGEAVAPTIETTLPGDEPSTDVSIVNKETATLSGTRGNVYVNTGGLLLGTGTVTALYNSGGTVNPGNSPGTLTVLETYSGDGILMMELLDAETYDQLIVGEEYAGGGNAVTLSTGATLDLVLYEGWVIEESDEFIIIDNRSETAVSGTFEGLAEGEQIEIEGITFAISYEGGDGNDVVLTALNAGTDPDAPNTGIPAFIKSNPALVALVGLLGAAVLIVASRAYGRNNR